jgi:hypothetical protein
MNDHLTVNAVIRTRDITRIVRTYVLTTTATCVFGSTVSSPLLTLVLSCEGRSIRETISWCR